MKFIIQKDDLNHSIMHVSRALSNKTTIPILGGIKIDADSQGVTLTASDTDISICSFIPCQQDERTIVQLEQTGSIVLQAKLFVDLIRKLPQQEVEIEVRENYVTFIRSGSSEVQFAGIDPEEYPLLPRLEENKILQLSSGELELLIKQTAFAVSTSESTPILTGVLWNLKNNLLKFTGCDRHRMATKELTIQDDTIAFNDIVISGKTLTELSRILPEQNTLVEIVVADNQVLFKMESILFYSRIIDGTYPDTSKLIPQSFQTEVIMNTRQLADAIDRAYLLSREDKSNIVKLVMQEDQTIELTSSSSELGKLKEQLPVEQITGELIKISFNAKYMLDALKIISSDKVYIGFTGTMQPIILRPENSLDELQLILPYRTTS